jgi:hypothetical protein
MAHLNFYKNDGESSIDFQPTLDSDDRVMDLLMYLTTESREIPKQQIEYHFLFSLVECKMLRDYITNLINEYERLNAI